VLKNKCIKVHVTAEQLADCSERAKKTGLSLSAYMLNAALSAQRSALRDDFLWEIAQREKLLVAIDRLAALVASRTVSAVDAMQILKLLEGIKNKIHPNGSFGKGAK
jgi:hypothetical protein